MLFYSLFPNEGGFDSAGEGLDAVEGEAVTDVRSPRSNSSRAGRPTEARAVGQTFMTKKVPDWPANTYRSVMSSRTSAQANGESRWCEMTTFLGLMRSGSTATYWRSSKANSTLPPRLGASACSNARR